PRRARCRDVSDSIAAGRAIGLVRHTPDVTGRPVPGDASRRRPYLAPLSGFARGEISPWNRARFPAFLVGRQPPHRFFFKATSLCGLMCLATRRPNPSVTLSSRKAAEPGTGTIQFFFLAIGHTGFTGFPHSVASPKS